VVRDRIVSRRCGPARWGALEPASTPCLPLYAALRRRASLSAPDIPSCPERVNFG